MKISRLFYFIYIFSGLLFIGCESSTDPEPRLLLQTVGFEGNLPDGQTVSFPSDYEANSEPLAFSYRNDPDFNGEVSEGNVASHYMHLNDLTRDFKISLRLPELKWSDVADDSFKSKAVFEEIYSYQKVKEVLSIGDKKIDDLEEGGEVVSDLFKVFYASPGIEFTYESGLYNSFYPVDDQEDPSDNYFKVVRQQEGFYKNARGEEKRLLVVEIELKVNMYKTESGEGLVLSPPIEGRLILAFKEFIPEWAE
ncbi:hypothetical protein [uncultured Algoriphagus sp.]|uniref:hypothetical protein n=1 Tax=uncultured Algoriphagus sp. TaxID=417365 RepID=UPI0030EF4EE9|tara:strand:- start:48406 stop:49161 length:756 start_codon:yes stop_codon:yes gene_type:complete